MYVWIKESGKERNNFNPLNVLHQVETTACEIDTPGWITDRQSSRPQRPHGEATPGPPPGVRVGPAAGADARGKQGGRFRPPHHPTFFPYIKPNNNINWDKYFHIFIQEMYELY